MSKRSCRDYITLLRILIDRVLELQDFAVTTFLDLTNAFGSVSQKSLDENASDKPRGIFRAIYKKTRAKVRVRGGAGKRTHTESFPIDRGIMSSPLCFIFALAYAFRNRFL